MLVKGCFQCRFIVCQKPLSASTTMNRYYMILHCRTVLEAPQHHCARRSYAVHGVRRLRDPRPAVPQTFPHCGIDIRQRLDALLTNPSCTAACASLLILVLVNVANRDFVSDGGRAVGVARARLLFMFSKISTRPIFTHVLAPPAFVGAGPRAFLYSLACASSIELPQVMRNRCRCGTYAFEEAMPGTR